ncbi:MAG: DUF937 domain-containing protein [Hyphomicrobiales bacterium]|nr:DUF937 domain-containing protein [Hyphomicrobiales bacterium]
MMNLIEIMQAAQGGQAYDNLARQFGIAPEQAQRAVQAVLPAFSLGLQQQAETLEGWSNILSGLASQGQGSQEFYDSDGDGIPDHLEEQGQTALGALFGSPEAGGAVAAQAAQFAGLPASLMQQMLPVIATMVLGGLFKGAANNGLGGLLGQMMQGGAGGLGSVLGGLLGGQASAPPPMPGGASGGMFGNILGSILGGGQPQPQPQAGGLGGILGSLLGGGAQPQAPQGPDPVAAGLDALKGMFQTGQQVQNAQLDALQQILGPFTQRR